MLITFRIVFDGDGQSIWFCRLYGSDKLRFASSLLGQFPYGVVAPVGPVEGVLVHREAVGGLALDGADQLPVDTVQV